MLKKKKMQTKRKKKKWVHLGKKLEIKFLNEIKNKKLHNFSCLSNFELCNDLYRVCHWVSFFFIKLTFFFKLNQLELRLQFLTPFEFTMSEYYALEWSLIKQSDWLDERVHDYFLRVFNSLKHPYYDLAHLKPPWKTRYTIRFKIVLEKHELLTQAWKFRLAWVSRLR